MAGSWFQDLEQKLDEQLEAFLRSNPDQRQRLEQQERQERSQWLHRRQKQLTASAGQQRQELMELAEEISRWRERVERARGAGAEDLAERAAGHLMRLMAQGREHWQALARFDGLDFVTPDQVQELAVPVIAHRLVIDPESKFAGTTAAGIVEEIIKSLPVPN